MDINDLLQISVAAMVWIRSRSATTGMESLIIHGCELTI